MVVLDLAIFSRVTRDLISPTLCYSQKEATSASGRQGRQLTAMEGVLRFCKLLIQVPALTVSLLFLQTKQVPVPRQEQFRLFLRELAVVKKDWLRFMESATAVRQ